MFFLILVFCLDNRTIELYSQLAGFELDRMVAIREVPSERKDSHTYETRRYDSLCDTIEDIIAYYYAETKNWFSPYDVKRDDPDLVTAVKILSKQLSNYDFYIVVVPNDLDWEIGYDRFGNERICLK